ncbi:MAG: citrate (Si)-synthase, partial [Candidatus Hydrogenedentes bacterium]|nr:citrate (Si)-synthase [Candidatus Hydrogenedentota bacterium]
MSTAKLIFEGKEHEFPVFEGTEDEKAIDISTLRAKTGAITYDPGYGNTGSCKSTITFIDGEKGILRYRGYPIEELAVGSKFPEVAYLLIYDHLPNMAELLEWRKQLTRHSFMHESMMNFFDHYPPTAHPMAILSAMIASLYAFYPNSETDEDLDRNIIRVLAQAKTIAAFSYKISRGEPIMYPQSNLSYAANFLRMMFGSPAEEYEVSDVLERALNQLLILHADHEQNCSTS